MNERFYGIPRVVYWNNQPTPYVVARFNAVADRGNVNFEAWFDGFREADRSWDVKPETWRFRSRILRPTIKGKIGPLPTAELREVRPDVFICGYDRLRYILGSVCARSAAQRTAVRSLPPLSAGPEVTRLKALALGGIFRQIDGAKVPGAAGRDFAVSHGLPADRVWNVTQSIDLELYSRGSTLTSTQRDEFRRRNDLSGCVFVYVGRIVHGKGIATLLDAYRSSRALIGNCRLLMVGDGTDLDYFRAETVDLPDVIWAGFRQPEDLPVIYGSADVMVFPTLGDPNGLVVEEALAAGIPVLSSDAAGDIRQRIADGLSGFIFPAGDSHALSARMVELATSEELRYRFKLAGLQLAKRYSVERYAEDFECFVQQLLWRDGRRGLIPALSRNLGRLLLESQRWRSPAELMCSL